MAAITVESHLSADWADAALRIDVIRAFTGRYADLPPKWLYDDRGSALFDQITRLPEYYLTEAERSILTAHAHEIASITGATRVVELGSGTSDKTTTLLDAFQATGQLAHFVPFDVSETTLRDAAERLALRYPGLEVHAIVGDFIHHLRHIPVGGQTMIALLGSTIGNVYQEERRAFIGATADAMKTGDSLLLGFDVVKDVQRLIDAYNDSEGISEQFSKNLLSVINTRFSADFDGGNFDYLPLWDPTEERIDVRLRATEPHRVEIADLGITRDFEEGEEIRVEVSTKFRPERLAAELADAGLEQAGLWFDEAGDYAVLLARKA